MTESGPFLFNIYQCIYLFYKVTL